VGLTKGFTEKRGTGEDGGRGEGVEIGLERKET